MRIVERENFFFALHSSGDRPFEEGERARASLRGEGDEEGERKGAMRQA